MGERLSRCYDGRGNKGALVMKRIALCIAGGLSSASCHSQPQTASANASGSQASVQTGIAPGGPSLQPGEYQYKSRTEEMKVPGMPADYGAKQIEEERSGEAITVVRHCVSLKEALDPRLIFSLEDKACRGSRFTMAGAKIDLQLVCQRGGITETKTVTGSYTPTSFSVDVSSSLSGGPQSGAEMKNHLDAKRIGACSEPNPG